MVSRREMLVELFAASVGAGFAASALRSPESASSTPDVAIGPPESCKPDIRTVEQEMAETIGGIVLSYSQHDRDSSPIGGKIIRVDGSLDHIKAFIFAWQDAVWPAWKSDKCDIARVQMARGEEAWAVCKCAHVVELHYRSCGLKSCPIESAISECRRMGIDVVDLRKSPGAVHREAEC